MGELIVSNLSCRPIVIRWSIAALAILPVLEGPCAAAENADTIARIVLDHLTANYAPVKTVQAKVVEVVVTPNVPQPTKSAPKEEPLESEGGTLGTFTISPRFEIKWSVIIAGTNERYEIGTSDSDDRETLLRRGDLVLDYSHGSYAYLLRYTSKTCQGQMQYNPREAMFNERDRSLTGLMANKLRRAEMKLKNGKRVAVLEVEAKGRREGDADSVFLLECPESASYLPTQMYQIDDSPDRKGVVVIGASIEYGRYAVSGKTVLFPKRIVRQSAGDKPVKTTQDFMARPGGQTITVTVSDLKLNAPVADNAFVAPTIPEDVDFWCDIGDDLSQVPAELHDRVAKEQRELRESLEVVKRILQPVEDMVGKPAPELPSVGWVGGKRPDVGGKPYLVAFWSTSCGPCKNDYPFLRQMAADGTAIIGIHPFGAPADEVAEFITQHKFGYPTILGQEEGEMVAGYPAVLFPHYIVVDTQGTVAAHGHLAEMAKKLDEMSRANAR
jgi:thiol-disulfide isomerase/thioredoxin